MTASGGGSGRAKESPASAGLPSRAFAARQAQDAYFFLAAGCCAKRCEAIMKLS
jgi:hypothetical protein